MVPTSHMYIQTRRYISVHLVEVSDVTKVVMPCKEVEFLDVSVTRPMAPQYYPISWLNSSRHSQKGEKVQYKPPHT